VRHVVYNLKSWLFQPCLDVHSWIVFPGDGISVAVYALPAKFGSGASDVYVLQVDIGSSDSVSLLVILSSCHIDVRTSVGRGGTLLFVILLILFNPKIRSLSIIELSRYGSEF
jgi:hypothetical protein